AGRQGRLIQRVREVAAKQTDPFYRHYMQALADQAEQLQRAAKRGFAGVNRWMGAQAADDFDDDDDDDWCDCPECRAARGEWSPFATDDMDDPEVEEEFVQAAIESAPPPVQELLRKLPPHM